MRIKAIYKDYSHNLAAIPLAIHVHLQCIGCLYYCSTPSVATDNCRNGMYVPRQRLTSGLTMFQNLRKTQISGGNTVVKHAMFFMSIC